MTHVNLMTALRLGATPRVALVGGGGKTTALFALAHEYAPPVIIAATAHLAVEQLTQADQHFFAASPADLTVFEGGLPPGITIFTGPANGAGKTTGLTPDVARAVKELAHRHHAPLFIEADGSKGRPLKAPAEHEPPLPDFVDTVIVVAGLSGVGRPLNADYVHRVDRYAALAGLSPDATVTPEAIAKVLCDPVGGLKNIPPAARRIALLNQADTPDLQAQAQIIARRLLPAYHAAVIAAVKSQQVYAVHEPAAGIILAAGASTRMSRPKPLLTWRGEPFVRQVARTALAADLSPVIVVAGDQLAEIQAAVNDLNVRVVHNADWATGQSTSIKAGLTALPDTIGSAIFLLVDQPHIPIELVRSLVARHAQSLPPVVAPLIEDRRGNPVLFDRVTFADLLALSGDVGGRAVFARHRVTYVPWHDAALLLDVDTPEDYQRLRALEDQSA